MGKNKVELAVQSLDQVKLIKDPLNPDISHIEALLSFKEAALLKRGNANVRPPEPNKRPFRAMLGTVEKEPRMFHLKNRGITYICSDAQLDKDRGVIIVTTPDRNEDDEKGPRYGIADGGHTFEVVNKTIREEKEFDNIQKWVLPFVRVHFLVAKGQEDIEDIVESLNTSSQVQAYTLDEYQGIFEELKNALSKSGFDPEVVAFRENEDKEWNVIEVIQRMSCFLKDRWVGTQPAGMYKSKGKALKLFRNEDTRSEFRQLYTVLKDIITLPEFIESEFSKGGIINAKSLAKLKSVKVLKKPFVRAGTNFATDHSIDMAGLLPMAAGFRELLVTHGDRYEWRVPVREVFKACAEQLYDLFVEKNANVSTGSQLGNDLEYWAGCAQIVLRTRNEMAEAYPEKVIVKKKGKILKQEDDGQIVEDVSDSQVDEG